jgi:orotidine-5'-phosphate decarboxylase
MFTEKKVILSADDYDRQGLLDLAKKIGKKVFCIKIHNLYDRFGPQIVSDLRTAGAHRVWVDAKLHDIPNTVKLRAQALADSGCDIITVHASGGGEMMSAAKQGFGKGKIFAVMALTSLDNRMIGAIYNAQDAKELVMRLAPMVKHSGADGMVCSPMEILALRAVSEYDDLALAVPGIRSAGVGTDDQKRFDTPFNALKSGADFLVIGRQITKAADPVQALDALEIEISQVIK